MEDLKDSNLISGAEAKLAWANGESLQIDTGAGFEDLTGNYYLAIFDRQPIKFRLKPQKIKLELELPKPFEPKLGDEYWFLNNYDDRKYSSAFFKNDGQDLLFVKFGAWRTESEIKQVVEQLGKIKGAV